MMKKYLQSYLITNWDDPSVNQLAAELKGEEFCEVTITRCCFEFARDEIDHSRTWN